MTNDPAGKSQDKRPPSLAYKMQDELINIAYPSLLLASLEGVDHPTQLVFSVFVCNGDTTSVAAFAIDDFEAPDLGSTVSFDVTKGRNGRENMVWKS